MITNFIHECRHVVAVTAITLLIALFGNVEEAVGGVTLTKNYEWVNGSQIVTGVTMTIDAAGDFAKYMNDRGGQLATEYKSYDNIVYKGPANVADFVALNRLTNPRLNLCQLTFDESDEKLNTAEKRLAELTRCATVVSSLLLFLMRVLISPITMTSCLRPFTTICRSSGAWLTTIRQRSRTPATRSFRGRCIYLPLCQKVIGEVINGISLMVQLSII